MATLFETQLEVRMYYWAPGETTPPHEHTAWTVTAVFHNSLEVTTYDYDVARRERRLATKNTFSAVAGRVGHIFEPCIHRPANRSDAYSTSIHVFHRLDGPRLTGEAQAIGGMGIARRLRPVPQEFLSTSVQERYQANLLPLAECRSGRARKTLERIADSGDSVTREVAVEARAMMDAVR
jgi:hypothetical protein